MKIQDILLLLSIAETESILNKARDIINNRKENIEIELYNIIPFKNKIEVLNNYKEKMAKEKMQYVSVLEDDYPELLRQIHDYPLGLFIKGNRKILNRKHLSIVGTRKPTYDGIKMCNMIMNHLQNEDVTIISGLAFGIDIEAHKAAIKYKIPTISVLPSSIENPVPKTNIKISKSIIETGGLLISEKPIGYIVKNYSYVQRNRIIAGMSDRLLIVEASIKSGTMTTAKFAIEQNRDVYAMPGSITNPVSEAPNYLIYNGATPVYKPEHFYEIKNNKAPSINTKFLNNPVYMYLKTKKIASIEDISIDLNININDIQVNLMELELDDIISRNNGLIILNE